jgi:hypothetical protein
MRDTAGGTPALPFEEAISSISYSLKKFNIQNSKFSIASNSSPLRSPLRAPRLCVSI